MINLNTEKDFLSIVRWSAKQNGVRWKDLKIQDKLPIEYFSFCNKSTKTIAQALIWPKGDKIVDWEIRISVKVFPLLKKKYQIETLVHESCHIIAWYLYGITHHSHGKHWKQTMIRCGYKPNITSDPFNIMKNPQEYAGICNSHVYECKCGSKSLISNRFNYSGRKKMCCIKCGNLVKKS